MNYDVIIVKVTIKLMIRSRTRVRVAAAAIIMLCVPSLKNSEEFTGNVVCLIIVHLIVP